MYLAVALKEYKQRGSLSYFYHFCSRKRQMERSKGNFKQRRHEMFPLYYGLETKSNLRAWDMQTSVKYKIWWTDHIWFTFTYLQGMRITTHSPVLYWHISPEKRGINRRTIRWEISYCHYDGRCNKFFKMHAYIQFSVMPNDKLRLDFLSKIHAQI